MELNINNYGTGGFDWTLHHSDENDDGITYALKSLYFDFSFLDDDDDPCDEVEHEIKAIESRTDNNADDISKNSSSGGTATTCLEDSQQSVALTEDDDETIIQHSEMCRCLQSSPFSLPSFPINSTSSVIHYDLPPQRQSGNDINWNQQTGNSTIPSSVNHNYVAHQPLPPPTMETTLHDTVDEDYSWCMEAASRIMISAEVHGKLLMLLRDYKSPKKQTQKRHSYQYKDKHCVTTAKAVPPNGWMTHEHILQHVPKLIRIVTKTYIRHIGDTKLPSNSISNNVQIRISDSGLQKIFTNINITPLHISCILQNVSGVQMMKSVDCSNICYYYYYYSIDRPWLLTRMNPKLGYSPLKGNIVLQLVEHRLLQLLDHSPNHGQHHHQQQRYCTNEICRVYEITFHEPLLFKPLGYNSFKDLISAVPSITRSLDSTTMGPNGNQWYIYRSSIS